MQTSVLGNYFKLKTTLGIISWKFLSLKPRYISQKFKGSLLRFSSAKILNLELNFEFSPRGSGSNFGSEPNFGNTSPESKYMPDYITWFVSINHSTEACLKNSSEYSSGCASFSAGLKWSLTFICQRFSLSTCEQQAFVSSGSIELKLLSFAHLWQGPLNVFRADICAYMKVYLVNSCHMSSESRNIGNNNVFFLQTSTNTSA